jgi:hypothetical protein
MKHRQATEVRVPWFSNPDVYGKASRTRDRLPRKRFFAVVLSNLQASDIVVT